MTVEPKKLQALVEKNSKKKPPMPQKGGKKSAPHEEPDDDEDEEGEEEDDHNEDDEQIVREVVEQLDNGDHDPELDELMQDYDDGENPPWATDHDTWERAKKAVDPEGKGADYDEPWAVVAHVYKKMGGKVKSDGDHEDDK